MWLTISLCLLWASMLKDMLFLFAVHCCLSSDENNTAELCTRSGQERLVSTERIAGLGNWTWEQAIITKKKSEQKPEKNEKEVKGRKAIAEIARQHGKSRTTEVHKEKNQTMRHFDLYLCCTPPFALSSTDPLLKDTRQLSFLFPSPTLTRLHVVHRTFFLFFLR